MGRTAEIDDRVLRRAADELQASSSLDAESSALARLVVARRSSFHFRSLSDAAREAGLNAEQIDAVDAEDWTDANLSDAQRAVFRYALTFDAGHGVTEEVFDELSKAFSPLQIADLSLLCAVWGAIVRVAIGLDYDEPA